MSKASLFLVYLLILIHLTCSLQVLLNQTTQPYLTLKQRTFDPSDSLHNAKSTVCHLCPDSIFEDSCRPAPQSPNETLSEKSHEFTDSEESIDLTQQMAPEAPINPAPTAHVPGPTEEPASSGTTSPTTEAADQLLLAIS
jgi:hypothetical protein